MIAQKWSQHQRRRLLLGGISTVVILAITPMFGNLVAKSSASPLAGIDHIGSICLIALHFLLTPVHYVLQGMLVAGLLYAMWDRANAWYRMRRVLQQLPAVHPDEGSAFAFAAQRAGLDLSSVYIVD